MNNKSRERELSTNKNENVWFTKSIRARNCFCLWCGLDLIRKMKLKGCSPIVRMVRRIRRRPPPPSAPLLEEESPPVLVDLVHPSLQQFTYGDLKMFTDDFSDDNFIGRTQFCKVYRGKIPKSWFINRVEQEEEEEQVVTVKIWADSVYHRGPGFSERIRHLNFASNFKRFKDEVKFLSTTELSKHPNLVKLMGWCCEIEREILGVVYDLNSYETLRNLIPGEMLGWEDRIKIALALASLLEALHSHQPRYLVLNISAAHIMIDQDFKPVLLEFGMLTTKSVCMSVARFPLGAYGYEDPYTTVEGFKTSTDVYGFGAILMELLSKCTVDGRKDFKVERPFFLHFSLYQLLEFLKKEKWVVPSGVIVEKSLMAYAGFNRHDEVLLTMLAVECIDFPSRTPRPSMKKVISRLNYLYIVAKSLTPNLV